MKEEQQKEVIPKLDEFISRAKELRKELDALLERQKLYQDESFRLAANSAFKLVASLQTANDVLKLSNINRIRDYVLVWYLNRLEKDNEEYNPIFEHISYDGNDTWTIVMTSTTYGRERVVVHSDAATWEQVYSAEKL